ncbi:MAG: hypothetical protein GEU78_01565 [Actinobacteria bacterium]|nr:hypothetical protein [Actinomycetota bacterium]
MRKIKAFWASMWADADGRVKLGRTLGFAFVVLGFVVIAKAWDGAAGQNWAPAQTPYLLSGGFMGLGLIITGATLLFLSTIRAERQVMTELYEEMTRLLGRNLSRLQVTTSSNGAGHETGEQVVAGATVYHRRGCKVLDGKESLMTVTVEQAEAEGLEPCRVCDPPRAAKAGAEATSTT